MVVTFILYNLALLLCSPLLVLYIFWWLRVKGKSRRGFFERLGFVAPRKLSGRAPRLWLHAASVGEAVAAKPVWDALLALLPGWDGYHSSMTDAGQDQAMRAVGDRGRVLFFPFDFLPCVWLSLARVRPKLVVILETELWPNFLTVAKCLGSHVMLANGIVSERSLRGGPLARWLYRLVTAQIDLFCMQSREDADRIIRLGADPRRVRVVGNTKFDQVAVEVPLGEQVVLRNALGLSRDEPVLLAGSTHPGEEEIVLRAFRHVKNSRPQVRLVIAPRHIQRAQEVEELVVAHGFPAVRRSKVAAIPASPDAVIILDTLGELARAYALCTAAFVGGSLVARVGGHNVLEPLGLGKPALFGPYMHKARDIAAIVQEAGIGFLVHDESELAARWLEFLTSPHRRRDIVKNARQVFQQHRGAAQRCADEAQHLVESTVPSPGSRVPGPES